jgi:creatinine amidohydrolase
MSDLIKVKRPFLNSKVSSIRIHTSLRVGRKFTLKLFLTLFFAAFILHAQEDPDPNRFAQEIQAFRDWDRKNALPEKFVLLVGSSSIRMWNSAESFPDLPVVNRGFGGAHISDLIYFKDDILLKYPAPECVLFFCGGNDIAGGKSAERVFDDFQKFRGILNSHAPATPMVCIPISPCASRWAMWGETSRVNAMVEKLCAEDALLYYADTATKLLETGQPPADSLFIEDKLHLSAKGYALWTSIIRPVVDLAIREKTEQELVLYEELTPTAFRRRIQAAPIAYVPLGTLEWHGEHLPLGADGLQSKLFFEMLAREAGGIVLPMLYLGPDRVKTVDGKDYYGMDTGNFITDKDKQYPRQQLDGSAYWLPENTFKDILEATWKQLARAGFKIVVAHGHGPSTGYIRDHAEEWQKRYGLQFFNCWGPDDSQGLGIMVDHAAMNETSLLMALRPELVHMEHLSADTAQWPVGVGGRDPRLYASAELGWKALLLQKQRMKGVLKEAMGKLGK